MTNDINNSVDRFVKAALGKKTLYLVVLDVRELSSVADAFIICSGRSNRQVRAIAEYIQEQMKDQGIKPLSVEGLEEGHWVLLDYGDVIIHIFYEPVRSIYDLEGLWVDASRITTKSIEDMEENHTLEGNQSDFEGDYDDDRSETL
jgi:ribosome-associated protein